MCLSLYNLAELFFIEIQKLYFQKNAHIYLTNWTNTIVELILFLINDFTILFHVTVK